MDSRIIETKCIILFTHYYQSKCDTALPCEVVWMNGLEIIKMQRDRHRDSEEYSMFITTEALTLKNSIWISPKVSNTHLNTNLEEVD